MEPWGAQEAHNALSSLVLAAAAAMVTELLWCDETLERSAPATSPVCTIAKRCRNRRVRVCIHGGRVTLPRSESDAALCILER